MSAILVVEDNPLNRRLLRDLLEYAGHAVTEAGAVPDAWEAVRAQRFDLVLLDVQIPGGGGELLLRRIREDADTAGLVVVAVTALAMPGDRERLLAGGFDAYVSKPIDTRAFLELTRRLLPA